MQKILVIQTAFIGDVVLATALIEKLHTRFPEADIDFLVRKGNETLLTDHPFLREVLVWDKRRRKLANLWRLLRRIRSNRYDAVINVQRFAATGMLTAFSGARRTIGFDKNPLSRLFNQRIPHIVSTAGGPHEIDRNQLLIRSLTDERPARPRLYPCKADEEKVRAYQATPYITVSPASVWFTKQYPAEKWSAFLRELPPGHTTYLLGAASDKAICERIRCDRPDIVDLSGTLSFLQSAALMRGARMNYVNDSAPMHFASAVNAPVTAVYCSTIPAFGFGPLSDVRHIVEIAEPLDCRPCGLHGYRACPRGHFKCAWKIEEAQLLQTFINSRP
ncbi:MAG TPA: glycosyltransferase family 9 protein [Puia sp.]|nr:glycosyltransferase family 9 protein [Puia sp.]